MFIHICVSIEWELERIRLGQWTVLWDGNNTNARNILQKAKEEWKEYRTWCDNMWVDWRCLWHNTN